MIFGIGCDICDIGRFSKIAQNLPGRIFSADEREMLQQKPNKPQSAAANFAVKEAFSKALGTGVCGFGLYEAEVLRGENGRPYIRVSGRAEKLCRRLGISAIHASISHDGGLAMGYVVLEAEEKR